ncbi:MAG: DegV family protein [Lachnospiraceae bacterium]|nr:DegV family protein [Lachnospiraceae bacterium]
MNYKIISDSSANLLNLSAVDFATVPLHIITDTKEFTDDSFLDVSAMQNYLSSYKGKSSTSCPNAHEWIEAIDDADVAFLVTITSNLSGACASAKAAASMYESEHPDKKVYVIDSLSTGPEMVLIINKLAELIKTDAASESIYTAICEYQKTTHLYFSLSSLDNLAKNGRINSILAKGIGILGIKIVGKASDIGTLQPMDKCRGDNRAYKCLINHMKKLNYNGGKIVISHTSNPAGAYEMNDLIKNEFGYEDAVVMENRALCSFYAEPGSILIGFEA